MDFFAFKMYENFAKGRQMMKKKCVPWFGPGIISSGFFFFKNWHAVVYILVNKN